MAGTSITRDDEQERDDAHGGDEALRMVMRSLRYT